MKAMHERIVGVMLDAIKHNLDVGDQDIWLDQSLKVIQRMDEICGKNFKQYGWNNDILALRPDITFWKKDVINRGKVKTL
jgi:hypothetical protein